MVSCTHKVDNWNRNQLIAPRYIPNKLKTGRVRINRTLTQDRSHTNFVISNIESWNWKLEPTPSTATIKTVNGLNLRNVVLRQAAKRQEIGVNNLTIYRACNYLFTNFCHHQNENWKRKLKPTPTTATINTAYGLRDQAAKAPDIGVDNLTIYREYFFPNSEIS